MVSGPLSGCRVLDFTAMMAGPFATMILAEQGADVIKVEPLQGDLLRQIGASRHGTSAIFLNSNRCKRSLSVDLKDPRGIEVVRRLADGADVIVQNFRPGVMDRLGLGYDAIATRNPRVVYASASGFGSKGPFAERRAYDPLIQAYSGISSVQGRGRESGPEAVRTLLGDKLAPVLLAGAISAALFERERSGVGQQLDTSMLQSLVWWLWVDVVDGDTFVDRDDFVPGPQFADMKTVYATLDGHIAVAATTDLEWQAFATAAERPDLAADERFALNAHRSQNAQAMYAEIAAVVATRSTEEWLRRFADADAGFAPVNSPSQLRDDPQLRAIGAIAEVDDDVLGRLTVPTHFAHFSRTPASLGTCPQLGEHTRAILAELGMSSDEIETLVDDRVVGAAGVSDQRAPQ